MPRSNQTSGFRLWQFHLKLSPKNRIAQKYKTWYHTPPSRACEAKIKLINKIFSHVLVWTGYELHRTTPFQLTHTDVVIWLGDVDLLNWCFLNWAHRLQTGSCSHVKSHIVTQRIKNVSWNKRCACGITISMKICSKFAHILRFFKMNFEMWFE